MNYYELQLILNPNTETNRDICAGLLNELGFESFISTNNGISAYIPEKTFDEKALSDLLDNLPLIDTEVKYNTQYIVSQNWNEEWERHFFQPINIRDQVIIHSSFHQDVPKDMPYPIVIDPKMSFGTGHHQTTSLMVEYLLDEDVDSRSFLDMGCGTAVLAILAKKKGALPVVAIDIDEWAYENSLENIVLNKTPEVQVFLGDASLLSGKGSFDIVFANINRNILLQDIPAYRTCMNPGASLFMSGFYVEDIPVIQQKCEDCGLQLVSYKEKDNWAAVHFTSRT
ncbi:50S ribosomal protein L11 methyltransferase [Bacteroidales bacterium OttesenSCG-928-M11]|nr:50S ribosomal protein L11 methyltransferase [Bacteroidales bacterium OttesenSCG-928-M11]